MNCPRCASDVSHDDDFCAKCGARLAGDARPQDPSTAFPPAAGSAAGRGGGYSLDVQRWTLNDRIAGGATLIVLISLFLPWFSVNLGGLSVLGVTGGVISESGTDAHGWLWIVFVVGLLLLLYLLVAVGFQALEVSLRLQHERLLLAATGLNLLLVLIGFALMPGNDGIAAVKIGWDFGAVLALIAAVAAVVPLARTAYREMNSARVLR
jgi:hypothetical protein